MKKSDQPKLTRRDLLAWLSAFGSAPIWHPVTAMLQSFASGNALANQSPTTPRQYFNLCLAEGPARWYFDLLLHPFAPQTQSNQFIANPGMNTAYVNTPQNELRPTYLSFPHVFNGRTYYLPQLWRSSMPRPDNTKVPMTELLNHMLVIRGVDMKSDGHTNNRRRQFLPMPGAGSLDGLVADGSSRPFPAVSLDDGRLYECYQSIQGVGQLALDRTGEPAIQQLLAPFRLSDAVRKHPAYLRRKEFDSLIDQTVGVFENDFRLRTLGTGGILRDRASARQMLKEKLDELPDRWNSLLKKYRLLIERCKSFDMPSINAMTVPGSHFPAAHRMASKMGAQTDLFAENADLRSLIDSDTAIQGMADSFAMAEFLLTSGYGAAFVGSTNLLENVNLLKGGQPQTYHHSFDEHRVGTAVSIMLSSFYFRSLATCLYELIQVLKARGLFEETVIQLSSEFSRTPRTGGDGSDHAFEGAVSTIFTGLVKAPLIVGNIFVNASASLKDQPQYRGTWGGGAPVEKDSLKEALTIGHATSTVADLLRVKRPLSNFSSVVNETSSEIQPSIEEAKNVG